MTVAKQELSNEKKNNNNKSAKKSWWIGICECKIDGFVSIFSIRMKEDCEWSTYEFPNSDIFSTSSTSLVLHNIIIDSEFPYQPYEFSL